MNAFEYRDEILLKSIIEYEKFQEEIHLARRDYKSLVEILKVLDSEAYNSPAWKEAYHSLQVLHLEQSRKAE